VTMDRFVCVIDDDVDIRDVLSDVLTFEGYDVLVASDGEEALKRLRGHESSCALILLDLMMTRMNGWEFRRKQAEYPALESVPVMLLTGAGGAAKAAADLQTAGVLEKPIELDVLLETVARFVNPAAQR
jgi:CheY-like chemotaxis protein